MAAYVKKYGGYENALRAYNAGPGAIEASKGFSETNHYVATILGGKDPKRLGTPEGGGGGGGATPGVPGTSGHGRRAEHRDGVHGGARGDPRALAAEGRRRAVRCLPRRRSQRRRRCRQGYQGVQSGGAREAAPDVDSILDALKTQGGDVQLAPGAPGTAGSPGLKAVTGRAGLDGEGRARGRGPQRGPCRA